MRPAPVTIGDRALHTARLALVWGEDKKSMSADTGGSLVLMDFN